MRYLALALFTVVVVAFLLVVPGSTDRRLLRPGPFRRTARSWRTGWARLVGAVLAWPHLLEGLLGLRRNPARQHDADEVWRLGPASVQRYRAVGGRRGRPVLLIHSFVTSPRILDLAPGRSLVGALVESGRDVYLLDWGHPGPAQAGAGFESYVATAQMVRQFVLQFSGARSVHVAGYCGGAAIALAALRDDPAGVASAIALAPPGDTTERWGMQGLLASPVLRPAWALDANGLVPAAFVRESFHLLRPKALRSIAGAWSRGRRDPATRPVAAAQARWVWEQRPIPGGLLFDLAEMSRANALLDRVGPIAVPLLVAVAERDHIVPPSSSVAVAELAADRVDVVRCDAGHVAMLSGSAAATNLYPALVEWLERADERSTTVGA